MASSDWSRNAYTSAMPSAFRSAWSLSNGPEQEGFEEILLPYRRRYLPLLQHILTIVFPDRRLSDPTEEFQGVH